MSFQGLSAEKNLRELFSAIEGAPQKVNLLPVSKGHSAARIALKLDELKIPRRLGENYWEELEKKSKELSSIEWHFLGRLQSRKIPAICRLASVLHTVSRVKELELIAKSARARFFIQVNISGEGQKNGCDEGELFEVTEAVQRLGLESRWMGFMGMAASLEEAGEKKVREAFAKLRGLRDRFCAGKELSMGMSSDYRIAIEEGSNWVRIGTVIFGERV